MNRFALNIDYGDRCFGRDSSYFSPDKFIEHHIAEHKNAALPDCLKDFAGALFG
jgi:hypothetical protein